VGRSALFGLVAGAAAVVVVAVAPGLSATIDPQPGDLVIKMRSSRFSVETLRAPAGTISLFVANPDLFWHTVTIPDLDVDVRVPVGGARRATFSAEPGRYDYVCRVPGHTRMQGVLIVGPPTR
jgi:plastocyanin